MKKIHQYIILSLIFLLACIFRLYNVNWDNGFHLHPDERAIVMSVTNLRFPSNIHSFLSPQSPWNPHFFAYGNFPFYLLKITGTIIGFFNPLYANYDKINLVGRVLSGFFDVASIFLLYLLSKKLFNKTLAFFAAFFYAISVLPIQLSHFYAVDTLLTFFILLTLYQLLKFYEKPSVLASIAIGICFGLAIATKVSALVLIVAIGTALIADFILLFIKNPHRPHIWFPHLPKFLRHLLIYAMLIGLTTCITIAIVEPYVFLDFKNFLQQTHEQQQMTKDAFTFPYTLQYVGKIPYLYEAKTIFLWGQGPLLASLSFIGFFYFIFLACKTHLKTKQAREIILLVFFLSYFFVVGKFAVGFMRYMLPLYPLLCLFAAVFIYQLLKKLTNNFQKKYLLYTFYFTLFTFLLVWPISFMHIYTKPNTRVIASSWIYTHIPPTNTIAIEHWDDQLPIGGTIQYPFEILALYEQDTPEKWKKINSQLSQTDYIIIASNRLYTPLQKLTDCKNLYPHSCYIQTAQYYKNLFSGNYGFKKAGEFTIYPTVPILNIPINDQEADESFTVYDHPKVIIFQRYGINKLE